MKFWPEKRWKKAMLTTLLILIVAGFAIIAFLEYSVYREIVTPLDIKNHAGAKTALVIYHPGLQSFSHDVAYGFADGIAENGWRVEIATASSQAPADLSSRNMLVLIWPIYDFNPGPTITNYLTRIGNLQGKDVAIVTIGGGIDPFNVAAGMQRTVQDANGTIRIAATIFRGGGEYAQRATNAALKILP